MKRLIVIIVLAISNMISAQNLIVNGNFQSGKDSWGGFNNQVLTDDMTNSKVGNVNNGEGSFLQVFDVVPNETYDVTFNYRWVSGTGSYNMTVRVKEGATGGSDLGTFPLNSSPDVWENQATFSFTAPAGISTVRLVFYKVNGNRPLRIDDVQVKNQNAPAPSFVDVNTPSNAQPIGVPGDWKLDFSDEFNDASLNLTKWYKSVSTKTRAPRPSLGITDWRWIAENAFLNNNGQLVLRATKINSSTMRCGSIESRGLYEPKFGYLEARIQIATTAKGNHTAFWMQGSNQGNVDNSGTDGAEVDIFESAWENNTTKAVVHYDGYGADKKNHTISYKTPGIHSGYHTFGLLWTENEMYVYYDGVRVTSTDPGKPFPFSTDTKNGNPIVPNVPQWLWLSVGASFADGDFQSQPVGMLSDALVDYVRVYKPNDATLSTSNYDLESIKVYPNPVKDSLFIKSKKPNFKVVIYDVKGRNVLEKNIRGLEAKIPIEKYPKGMYLVKILSEDSNQIFKVLF